MVSSKMAEMLVPPARFEHAAYGLGNRCSIRLSYGGTGQFGSEGP